MFRIFLARRTGRCRKRQISSRREPLPNTSSDPHPASFALNSHSANAVPMLSCASPDQEAFCTRWQVTELALFGSVLRADFAPYSDIDMLVRFWPEARHTLLELAEMERELGNALGRRTDLVERSAAERSANFIRRRAILGAAETICVA